MIGADNLKILCRLGFNTREPKIFSFHDCLPDNFSEYIELLVLKRYKILGSDELIERLSSQASRNCSYAKEAVLTFDDGRRNCWTVIFPLLKKYRVKALFFVIPSRISSTHQYYPNLEDYWNGKVSWENLYLSHRSMPYLSWRELEIMQASGFVDIFSHGLMHNMVKVSPKVVDFQHPGVYEMPVYFDEWIEAGRPELNSYWGAPIYESTWSPLASNAYVSDRMPDEAMNTFVKKNGGFLFFKKRRWRSKLFNYYRINKKSFSPGVFKRLENREDARQSIFDSKKMIEERLKRTCHFFSLPFCQVYPEMLAMIQDAGYKGVFTQRASKKIPLAGRRPYSFSKQAHPSWSQARTSVMNRIPADCIKLLSFF